MQRAGNKGAIAGCNSNPPNPFPQKSKQLRHLDQTRRTMSTPLGTSTNFSPPNSIYLCPLCTGEGDRDPRNAARCSSSGQVSIRTSGELGTGDRMAAAGAKIWRSQPSRAVDEVRSALSFVTRFSPVIP
jgi:hypothetical protein